jgi:oxalate decarboxylase/phosphoglucose isomerase-like protein (cupin superfamily)
MKMNLLLIAAGALSAAASSFADDSSTVVFENDQVRTVLYRTTTGRNVCGFGLHWHPPHLYIMKTAGKFRVTTPDGKAEVIEAKAGEVGWEPAVTHRVETVSPETVEVYLVEVKDKDWKPSTNLKPQP